MVPLDVNGEWSITGGKHEYEGETYDREGDILSGGSLTIKDESATLIMSIEGEETNNNTDNEYDWEVALNGTGFAAVNGKDKVITIFWTNYNEEWDYPDGSWEEEHTYKENSAGYRYSIDGSTMTLTRRYQKDSDINDDSYKYKITETVTLTRK